MATIYEIAKAAKVSPSTVSRALSGNGYVSREKKERIEAVAATLYYRPNALARALVTKRSNTIAFVVADIGNPFFPAIARGVEDEASSSNYNVILCNTDSNRIKADEYIRALSSRQTDGVIFCTASVNDRHVKEVISGGIPVVLGYPSKTIKCDTVSCDNLHGGMIATEHLIGLGHTTIGIISALVKRVTGGDRLRGYKKALSKHGLPLRKELIVEGDYSMESGYEKARLLLRLKDRPTAIFATNDLMAIGAMNAIEEIGLRVPDDIAIIGYDDIPMASIVKPKLTTVAQPKYEIGQLACKAILERMGNPNKPWENTVLKPKLIVRNSSVVMDTGRS